MNYITYRPCKGAKSLPLRCMSLKMLVHDARHLWILYSPAIIQTFVSLTRACAGDRQRKNPLTPAVPHTDHRVIPSAEQAKPCGRE